MLQPWLFWLRGVCRRCWLSAWADVASWGWGDVPAVDAGQRTA
jgi:hypothetical protein